MARSHWPMDTKRMHKGHSGRAKFRGWLHPFSSAPEMDKICENLRKQNGKERTWVVCSGDVKRMFIGCIADEADASRTPNGNKGDVERMYIGCKPFTAYAEGMNCVRSVDIKGCSTHAVSIKRKDVLAATSIHLYYISLLKKATLIHLYYLLYQHHGASVRQEKEVRAYLFKPWQGEEGLNQHPTP